MAHEHTFYFRIDGNFGLIADKDSKVHVELLDFNRYKDLIAITVRAKDDEFLVYANAQEAMRLAAQLRKMAIAAFAVGAGEEST